jgi:hypothetical protein
VAGADPPNYALPAGKVGEGADLVLEVEELSIREFLQPALPVSGSR